MWYNCHKKIEGHEKSFTEEEIIKKLKEHEGGRPATDIVRDLVKVKNNGFNSSII